MADVLPGAREGSYEFVVFRGTSDKFVGFGQAKVFARQAAPPHDFEGMGRPPALALRLQWL